MRRDHQNAFDAARLILAIFVFYSHATILGGLDGEGFARLVRNQTAAGTFALLGFFGISGFLVTQSFVVRNNGPRFVLARLLRIVPGFYLSLILTAFVFAPAISHFNPQGGPWQMGEATAYVLKNAFVRITEWNVGGVLAGMPPTGPINGPLWSLFPELICYGLVLGLGLAGSLHAGRINLLLFALLVAACHFALVVSPDRENLAPTLLSLSGWTPYVLAFLVGSVASAYRLEMGSSGRQAIFWWVVVAVLLKFGGWALLAPFALPLALIHGAGALRINLPVDLSYGIYVLHYPILHLAAAAGLQRSGFTCFFLAALLVTLIFAYLSWTLVERPALKFKLGINPKPAGGNETTGGSS